MDINRKEENMENVLEIKNLSKFFGKTKVVDNINLNIKPGEIYGFLGPNGARKNNNYKDDIRTFKYRRGRNKSKWI